MPLPAPRLVVTGHTKEGTSTYLGDQPASQFSPFGPSASSFSTFHASSTVPVDNIKDFSGESVIPRSGPNGVVFCTTDIPGNYTVPMHRTISIDYIVIISGEIVLKLNGGEEKTIKAGEIIIQKGTNHSWINRTDEVCRIAVVAIGSEKIKLEDGTVLEELKPKPPGQ
jgi:quercetin dioxygenase-like cupin family protein